MIIANALSMLASWFETHLQYVCENTRLRELFVIPNPAYSYGKVLFAKP
jgi:hypothetical protein